jgi:hypothetical protein
MALVTGTIRNLFGGVSQAPAEQRSASQFEELLNVYPRSGFKLSRRPPLQHLAEVVNADLSGAFVHELGDYTLIVSSAGVPRVVQSASGTVMPLTDTTSGSYLAPASALRAVSAGNAAYILNSEVSPTKGGSAAGTPSPRAHLTVWAGDYETKYSVVLDGIVFSYTTPAQATAGSKAAIATDAIAAQLHTLINAHANYTSINYSSNVFVQRADGMDFSCITYDGIADAGLSAAKDTVKQFSQLPPRAEVGTVIKVLGENATGTDDYYVKCVASDGSLAVGDMWQECTEPGAQYNFDPETMPVRLVDNGDGTFTLEECPWVDRQAGDDTTVPFPSFVGETMSDIFIHQGRLGFLSRDKIILSTSGDLFNFFRGTATQILASDPIDVNGSISGVVQIDFAINWNEALYLFANGTSQYRIDSDGALTVETIQLVHKSEYRYDPAVRPIVVGSRMFFVTGEGGYPHVVDYFSRGYERVHTAVDTGTQVPTYFTGTPKQLLADDTRGVLFFRTSTGVYVYNYRYDNDERVQGAWHRWTFGSGTILSLAMKHGILIFWMAYADGTFENYIQLDRVVSTHTISGSGLALPAGSEGEEPCLDRLVSTASGSLTRVFDGTYTVFTLPYEVAVNDSQGGIGLCFWDGRELHAVTRPSATTFRVVGDVSAAVAWAGVKYNTDITLSTLYVRDRETGTPDLRGHLQLRTLRLQYSTAEKITVIVSRPGRTDTTTNFTSALHLPSGELVVPILTRNTDCSILIRMDSAAADGLTGISWEGTYHVRAARL